MSIRSSTRAFTRSRRRGFVLVSALVIALLYLALIELVLAESALTLRQAQRYRGRVVARILAENAADLASQQMIGRLSLKAEAETEDGSMVGEFQRTGPEAFVLEGTGRSAGTFPATAQVRLSGRITGLSISIDRSVHSQ